MIVIELQLLHLLHFLITFHRFLGVIGNKFIKASLGSTLLVLLRLHKLYFVILNVRVFLNLFQRNPDLLEVEAVHADLLFRHLLNYYLLPILASKDPHVAWWIAPCRIRGDWYKIVGHLLDRVSREIKFNSQLLVCLRSLWHRLNLQINYIID